MAVDKDVADASTQGIAPELEGLHVQRMPSRAQVVHERRKDFPVHRQGQAIVCRDGPMDGLPDALCHFRGAG